MKIPHDESVNYIARHTQIQHYGLFEKKERKKKLISLFKKKLVYLLKISFCLTFEKIS